MGAASVSGMKSSESPKDGSRFWASRGPELTAALTKTMAQIRLLYADTLDVIAELDRERVASDAGYSSLAAFLAETVRITPSKAARMIAQANQVAESVTPTGHVTPAPQPHLREALREGVVDGEHIDAVADTLKKMPIWASVQDRELVESTLAEQARTSHPLLVRRAGDHLLARLDQDGENPHVEADQAEPVNSFKSRRNRDGRMEFSGSIEPEAAEELQELLDAFGKPQPLAEGVPDPRPVQQRHGDAFTDIIHRAAQGDDLPTRGGEKPHLSIFLDLNTLVDGVGTATLDSGAAICPSAVRRVACDAEVIPIVLGEDSEPLDVGRKYRTVTPAQRRALVARDRGCAHPGCDRPPRWCDAHHIIWWKFGGDTNIANLVLLCRRHHRLVHHSEWDVEMVGGRPMFYPPKWLELQRNGIRNTLHHLRE